MEIFLALFLTKKSKVGYITRTWTRSKMSSRLLKIIRASENPGETFQKAGDQNVPLCLFF